MSKILGAITGIFTSGFGLKKVYDLVTKALKVRKLVSDAKDVYEEGKDVYEEGVKAEELYHNIMADNKITADEAKKAAEQLFKIVTEIKEAYKEAMDFKKKVTEIFG